MKPVFWWTIAIVCTVWVAFGIYLVALAVVDSAS